MLVCWYKSNINFASDIIDITVSLCLSSELKLLQHIQIVSSNFIINSGSSVALFSIAIQIFVILLLLLH